MYWEDIMKVVKTLVEQTIDKLLAFISTNQLEVGDKLPNEYELAKKLDVGRSTLREAVRSLASRNILEVRQGSGTFISDKKGIVKDPLGFSLIRDKDKMILDLFELRYIIEPPMAALAAKNATEDHIKKMIKLKNSIEDSFEENTQDHVLLDIELHKTIAEASGNVALLHIVPIINESIALFNESYNINHIKLETMAMHRELVDAIKNKDEIGALDAMTIHMANNRKEIRHIIKLKN